MSDNKRNRQSSDAQQTGGGLGQTLPNFENTYNVQPDSIGSGQISPNSDKRGREGTRGK